MTMAQLDAALDVRGAEKFSAHRLGSGADARWNVTVIFAAATGRYSVCADGMTFIDALTVLVDALRIEVAP
jgi:hypothetical protein